MVSERFHSKIFVNPNDELRAFKDRQIEPSKHPLFDRAVTQLWIKYRMSGFETMRDFLDHEMYGVDPRRTIRVRLK